MNKFVKFPLVLGIVGVICTGALSLVYEITKGQINFNRNQVAINLMSGIVDDLKNAESVLEKYGEEEAKKHGISNMYEVTTGAGVVGYGYLAEVNGYNPGINFIVVLSNNKADRKILGFDIVSHSETNSGTYGGPLLNSPEFSAQFKDISFDDVASEVDFVAGSTAKVTLGAIHTGVDDVISFHKQAIFGEADDGIELGNTERQKLGLQEGDVMVDKTEEFKTALQNNKVSANVFDRIMNVTVKDGARYTKIWNYIEIQDSKGNSKGNAFVVEGQYNCEVEHGARAWQKHKFVLMFDTNGANTKLVVVTTTDTLGAVGKDSLDNMSWVSENYNGKTMTQLKEAYNNESIDIVAGASYTSDYFREDAGVAIDAYIRAYGN